MKKEKLNYKTLKYLLKELDEQAQELIDYGNSKEKAEGFGMKNVTKAIYEYYKKENNSDTRSCTELIPTKYMSTDKVTTSTPVKIMQLNLKNSTTDGYSLGDVLLLGKYECELKECGWTKRQIELLSPNFY